LTVLGKLPYAALAVILQEILRNVLNPLCNCVFSKPQDETELLLRLQTVSGFRVGVGVPADDWANVAEFYDVLVFNTEHW
jgi:hypothetical protein